MSDPENLVVTLNRGGKIARVSRVPPERCAGPGAIGDLDVAANGQALRCARTIEVRATLGSSPEPAGTVHVERIK